MTIVPESLGSATVSRRKLLAHRQSLIQQLNRVKLDVRNSDISLILAAQLTL